MRLPKDIISGNYTKPRIFLCETNKEKICQLDTTNTHASLRFNTYSELSFDVARVYNDIITGKTKVNPYFDKIETPRIIYLEGIGCFEIQGPEFSADGIKESKAITAYSLEYSLSQKYLTNFLINTGKIGSVEVMYAEEQSPTGVIDIETMKQVVFYDPDLPELSLLHLVFEGIYGWKIGNVDYSLRTMCRTFEIERESVYDFLMNEVCSKFNCYIVFDTINNIINFYAESQTQKFIGDGVTNEFTLFPPFEQLSSVSVDGYKTTRYTYNPSTGKLILNDTPQDEQIIEIVDGALSEWDTDVFVTFDNLSKEININYDADEIKTVLTVTGSDGLDISEVNMGLPYIVDLSYYCSTPDWLGEDLYHAYNQYLKDYNSKQGRYEENSQKINKLDSDILYEKNRMSAGEIGIVEMQQDITSTTVGKYFVRGGTAPNYYYTEVSLPDDYDANTNYYLFVGEGINLTETKVDYLYHALQDYFKTYFNNKSVNMEKLDECAGNFSFIKSDFDTMCNSLRGINTYLAPKDIVLNDIESTNSGVFIFACVNKFLNTMWNQLGSFPLEYCYKKIYTNLQTTAMEAGWGSADSTEYGNYFAVYLIVKSIERALSARTSKITELEKQMETLQKENINIGSSLEMNTYLKQNYPDKYEQFMLRLSAFWREDEYTDDSFVVTGYETLDELYQLKRELKECGKIELNRLSQPKLQFSMTMDNIYAIPEFEPIMDQFKLGNVIKIGLRKGCVKQSRLMQVDMGLDDMSDFSCEFGELTSTRSQSDIHADLLSQAISAGKTVASNESHWNKGADQVNEIDLRIQRGLIDAATSIKSMDGNQGVEIDNYGIHLRKTDPETQEYDPEQGWITNNKFLYSNDAFKTVKSVFGKYKIDDQEYWGLLSDAVIAGYIEGSKIKGGVIQIGDIDGNPAFEVDQYGNVSMLGGQVQFNVTNGKNSIADLESSFQDQIDKTGGELVEIQGQIDTINNSKMYRIEIRCEGPQILRVKNQTAKLSCHVYSWDADITNSLDASFFSWKRHSDNPDHDEIWNNMSIHKGCKTLTISTEDIIENANFSCEVNLPDNA